MGLKPLEFADCLMDSPEFRDNLHVHEKELDKTSRHIKELIKEVKDLLNAAKVLSQAQRKLAKHLQEFRCESTGSNTDDELVIADSLKEIGRLIATIENERDRLLDMAHDQFIVPLETFRKEQIGEVKEGKKKFDKHTAKFCQSQERYLNLSTKKVNTVLQEADASLEMEQRDFCRASLDYVYLLQQVQEKKTFHIVETVLSFVYSWLTFYHQGHEICREFKPQMTDIQVRVQRTRENFEATEEKAAQLKQKMLEVRTTKNMELPPKNQQYTRQGYLFLMEKKALGTTWTKHYCSYLKEKKEFTMINYNQVVPKQSRPPPETFILSSCVRRSSDSIEKRFCFDLTAEDKPGVTYTLQALSEEDRKLWMDAMDGREPTYVAPGKVPRNEETSLDDNGFDFITRCIAALERRGLEDQGMYRLVGVSSKVNTLLNLGLTQRTLEKVNFDDEIQWETKTITSTIKQYFRNLKEPVMTFRLHSNFIVAAKQETLPLRIQEIHGLIHQLPKQNLLILDQLFTHLKNVANKSDKNLMTVSNLGVCFGPTLLRPEEESVAAIMDIKFCNVVVEILIENYDKIFAGEPNETYEPHRRNSKESTSSAHSHTGVTTTSQPTPNIHTVHHSSMHNLYAGSPGHQNMNLQSDTLRLLSQHGNSAQIARESVRHEGPPPYTNPPSYYTTAQTSHVNSHSYYGPVVNSHQHSSSSGRALTSLEVRLRHPAPPPPQALTPPQRSLYPHNPLPGNERTDGLHSASTSSSRESLSSRSSSELNVPSPQSTKRPYPDKNPHRSYPGNASFRGPEHISSSQATTSPSSTPQSSPSTSNLGRVRTLYACVGENDSELSFEPNQIIYNVRQSKEPGWLEGILNGKTGLVPENYVEYL